MGIKLKLRAPFGQVEPNHLTAQRNGAVYAQLPAKASIEVLENGMFANYNYKDGCVDFTKTGAEWMLVFNEVKLYGEKYNESWKDYAMQKKNFTNGEMTPRLFKTAVGDIFTTDTVVKLGGEDEATTYTVGDILKVNADGYLYNATVDTTTVAAQDMEWTVVAETTLPDAITPAVKIQRTK